MAVGIGSLAVAAPVGAAHAEEPSASVTVRARPVGEAELSAPTAFVSEVDPRRYADEGRSAADALGDSVGVSVRRFGGLGAFSTLSIRGSSANQVQVYLDGIPVSRAQNEAVNLADLPLDALEKIDVYRGSAPARFGIAGIGGIVNFVTRSPGPTPQASAALSYGSFDTRKFVGSLGGRLGRFDLLGFVTYLGSSGDFPYRSDNQTPLNQDDDFETRRRNNSFNSTEALLKAGTLLNPNLRLEVSSQTFWKENGLPGLGANPSLRAEGSDLRSLNYLRLRSCDWLLPRFDADASLYGSWERTTLSDPSPHGDLGGGPQDRHDSFTMVGGNLAPTKYFGNSHSVNGFVEAAYERYAPENDRGVFPEPDADRLRTTLSAQYQGAFFSDLVLLVPTLRYEHLQDATDGAIRGYGRTTPALDRRRDLFSPAFGAEVRPLPWLSLRGNLGLYQRAPNFTELFGNSGSVLGNAALDAESAVNRDVGFVAEAPRLPAGIANARLEYAYFNNDIEDLIVFVPRTAAIFRPENLGRARVRGHELGARADLARVLRAELNYTQQDAENRSPTYGGLYLGKQIPGRPAHELYSRLTWLVGDAVALHYELNFVSGNYVDEAHLRGRIPARDTHGFGVQWKAVGPLTVGFQARNVTDNRISDVAGFPLPGRSYFGTVQVNL